MSLTVEAYSKFKQATWKTFMFTSLKGKVNFYVFQPYNATVCKDFENGTQNQKAALPRKHWEKLLLSCSVLAKTQKPSLHVELHVFFKLVLRTLSEIENIVTWKLTRFWSKFWLRRHSLDFRDADHTARFSAPSLFGDITHFTNVKIDAKRSTAKDISIFELCLQSESNREKMGPKLLERIIWPPLTCYGYL